jgi:hypothetical protein
MKRFLLAGLMLVVSACAFGQAYPQPDFAQHGYSVEAFLGGGRHFPLQYGHSGLWSDPARNGEGLSLIVTKVDDRPFVFGTAFFLLGDGSPQWFAFQGFAADRCELNLCEFALYRQATVNGPPVTAGSIWLETIGFEIDWTVTVGLEPEYIYRDARLKQSLRPPVPGIGACTSGLGFGPHPPAAPPEFCP